MSTPEVHVDVVLCGPPMAPGMPPVTLKLSDTTPEQREVIERFGEFLAGRSDACPICMAPMTSCTKDSACCPDCPGWHVTSAKTKKEVR